MPLPQAIVNAPELQLGLDLFYVAFTDLSTCRSIGMSEGPIPWTAVRDYCDELLLEGDQREDMFFHIREMDVSYLNYRTSKVKSSDSIKASEHQKPAVKVTKRAA